MVSLKICLISPQYPGYGGYGVYLSYLAKGLKGRGHEVHTLTGPPPGSNPQANDAGFHILPTGSYEGFRFVNFELVMNKALNKLQKQEGFDLVQYNLPAYLGIPLFHPPSLPLLITAHGCIGELTKDFLRYKPRGLDLGDLVYLGGGPFFPRMDRWAFSKANRIVAISEWVKRAMIEVYGLPPERVAVVHNGIDTVRFHPEKDSRDKVSHLIGAENLDRPLVLFMARIMGAKDPATLARAIPRVLDSHPDALFLFRGDSVTLHTYFRSLLARLAPPSSYKLLEFIRDTELSKLYSASSVYVLPSIHEPLGYTLLEALSCGTAAVASAVGGIPEIISSGENGILVPPRDSTSLSDAITRLLSDPKLAQELGRRGRRTVESKFNLESFVERFDSEMQEAAA